MTQTILERFEKTARERDDAPALKFKRDGQWQAISWRGYRERVLATAAGFAALGVEPGDGVVILGQNRPEWFIADIGAIAAGGVPVGIYVTSTPEQVHYISEHCEAAVAVVENHELLERFDPVRRRLPKLRATVLMEGEPGPGDSGVISWGELQARGGSDPEAAVRPRIDALRPDDLATLIYTSGTTGPPKGVMLSHRNLTWTAEAVVQHLTFYPGDDLLSYLPLSHIAEQMVTLHGPLSIGACTWFAESLEAMPENLREVRPHAFLGVPRVWEKIQAGIAAAGAKNPPLKRAIARWARAKGLAGGYAEQRGERPPALYGLARRLVFDKVRARLGLDRARICVTSAAPISLDTLEFFLSLGLPILEVYGMTEVTGPGTISLPERYRTGRAGFALPGTELRIAEDGEILMRGPHVCLGYYKNEEATRETIDGDGWLHSGDVGEIDGDGFLAVTDRKKELLVTSGGKNVAPAPIESLLRAIPAVGAAVVIGDRRNYLTALLTLDPERIAEEAKTAGSAATDTAEAAGCATFRAHLEARIEAVNDTLARYESIKRFRVLPEPFSVDGGELTPTLKLRRRVIAAKYEAEIEALYPR